MTVFLIAIGAFLAGTWIGNRVGFAHGVSAEQLWRSSDDPNIVALRELEDDLLVVRRRDRSGGWGR